MVRMISNILHFGTNHANRPIMQSAKVNANHCWVLVILLYFGPTNSDAMTNRVNMTPPSNTPINSLRVKNSQNSGTNALAKPASITIVIDGKSTTFRPNLNIKKSRRCFERHNL